MFVHRRSVLLALALLALPDALLALPRYSVRYRQNCNLCHHNPTGGGMRDLYASTFLVPNEMALQRWDVDRLERIRPDVSESVTVGTDIRTAHHYADIDRPAPENNFFQMQGDFYVRFQVDQRFSAYLDQGMSSTLELFGLAYVLPGNGFLKFGRFTPAFGWKFADHGQFVRRDLFFQPPGQTDVGMEVGVFPGRYSLVASVLNGAGGSTADTDAILATAVRGSARFAWRDLGVEFGGSYWRNSETGGLRQAGGPFGAFLLGRFTWLWEVDWSSLDPVGASTTTTLVTSHELAWQLVRGLDLRGVVSFLDPDVDAASGTRARYGLGVDTLVSPFFGVQAMVHRYDNDRGTLVTEASYTQSEVILHLLY